MSIDHEETLSRLKQLKAHGLMSDEEFHQRKIEFLFGETISVQTAVQQQPRLWNPKPIYWLSLCSLPSLATFVHMKNWKALGEHERATNAMVWLVGSIGLYVLHFAYLYRAPQLSGLLSLCYFVIWHRASGRFQSPEIEKRFGSSYRKKSLAGPLIFFICFWALGVLSILESEGLLPMADGRPACNSQISEDAIIDASENSKNHPFDMRVQSVRDMRQRDSDPGHCIGTAVLANSEERPINYDFEISSDKSEWFVRYEIPAVE